MSEEKKGLYNDEYKETIIRQVDGTMANGEKSSEELRQEVIKKYKRKEG